MIAFFDMFDYPLTVEEIWLNLSVKCGLYEVMAELEKRANPPYPPFTRGADMVNPPNPPFEGGLENKNGFYFLAGREKNIEERLNRYNFTARKFKRAMLIAGIFKFIPWIKMMAVGNLIGAHNLKDSSDIDFFIIAEDKKIWLTRWFCAGAAKLLGLRPQTDNARDKICLSFYASEGAMDLSGSRLSNPPYPPFARGAESVDIYFTYWLAGLTPLYDIGGMYEKLIKANWWLNASLPNWQPLKPSRQRQVKPLAWEFYHDIINLFMGGLEPQFKALQLRLLPPELKNLMNLDSRVVVNDKIIKLHANDRREEYKKKYEEKINSLSSRA